MMQNVNRESIKTMIWGLIWIIGAFLVWFYIAGNPFDELKLILYSKTTSGFIINTSEDAESGDDGSTKWFYTIDYTYKLPNGQSYNNHIHSSGQLKEDLIDIKHPYPVIIEYLPSNPQVSRLQGDGNSTIFEWVWRRVGLGGLLLILFVSPGFILFKNGFHEMIISK